MPGNVSNDDQSDIISALKALFASPYEKHAIKTMMRYYDKHYSRVRTKCYESI